VTHWQPQAPAREYMVGATGKTALARMSARVGATLWVVDGIAGLMLASRMVEVAKSLPTEPTIPFSFPTTVFRYEYKSHHISSLGLALDCFWLYW